MDSIEALWSINFISNVQLLPGQIPTGGGIVVFETGHVLGGDSAMTYVGYYRCPQGDNRVEADIEVNRFLTGGVSVFGSIDHFHLKLTGQYQRDRFVMEGSMVEHPDRRITIQLIRRVELP